MSGSFLISTTSGFVRDLKRILKRNPHLKKYIKELREILEVDPTNNTRQHNIRKLKDVSHGKGQWRIRKGDYRLRYDIEGNEVILYSFRDRKEGY